MKDKSVTELREIALSLGVGDVFSLTTPQLMQEIELKHKELIPTKEVVPEPVYIKANMDSPEWTESELLSALQPYIERGLKVSFKDGMWRFSHGIKNDTGNMRMPMKIAIKKAVEILK